MFKKGKSSETSQRFAIKKYSFGVASALVGVFLAAGANAAHAEETAAAAPAATSAPTAAAPATTAASAPATPAPVAPAATEAPVAKEAPKAASTGAQTGTAETAKGVVVTDNGIGSDTTPKLTKYTLTEGVTATEPMEDIKGAQVKGVRPTPAGYQTNPDTLQNTFAIFDFKGANETDFKDSPKYVRISRSYDETNEDLTIQVVNKNDHSVYDEMVIKNGETKTLAKITKELLPGSLTETPEAKYSILENNGVKAYNLQFGRWAGTVEHVYNSIEPNLVAPSYYTDVNYTLAKIVDQSTYYVAVDPTNPTYDPNKTDVTTQTYEANGKEKTLASFTQVVMSGQAYKASGVREFEGYKLYQTIQQGTDEGYVQETLPLGHKYRNAFGQQAKRIVEVVGPNNTTKIQLWYRDPNSTAPDTQANNNDTNLVTDGYILAAETVQLKGEQWNTEPLVHHKETIVYATDDNGVRRVLKGRLTAGNASAIAAGSQVGNYFTTYWENLDGTPYNGNMVIGGKVYGTGHMRLTNSASALASDVVYYYVQEGRVLVNYVDAETGAYLSGTGLATVDATTGTTIVDKATTANGASVTDTNWVLPGEGVTYDTAADYKPAYIKTADGKLYRLVAKEGTTADGKTYGADSVLTGEGNAAEKGNVLAGTQTVTYAYELVKGDVVVNYIREEDGAVIKEKVTDTPLSVIDTEYDTAADNKPAKIVAQDGKTYVLVPEKTIGEETGKVKEGTIEVTYVYREVKNNNVIVNYVDEEGNVIKDPVEDTKDSSTGVDYNTSEDNKPNKITTKDGKTYVIIPEKTIGEETGKVKEGTTEVTYVYKEVKGDVIVHYVTEDGEVLKETVTDTPQSSTGVDYDTTDNKPETIVSKDGKLYVLIPEKTVGTEKGKVVEGTTEITYVYGLAGDVIVHYINTKGETIKETAVDTKPSKTGTDYNTADDNKPETIVTPDGKTYRLLPALTRGTEQGKVVEGTTEITYIYEEVKGDVIVHYIEEGTGRVLANPVTDTKNGATGTDYDTTDNKPAIINENEKIYALVEEKTIGAENGKVVEGVTEITYVYREVKGAVVVNYIEDETGKVLAVKVTDTAETSVGTLYDTTDNKPAKIVTADGKTYVLLPEKTIGTEHGKVVEGVTEITYVYKESKLGNDVVVNYVDENGNVIKDPVNDTKDSSTGVDYNTSDDNKPKTIVTPDGKTYVIVPEKTIGEETGKVKEGKTEVTYVYREDKDNNVIVHYVDENGNVIKETVFDTKDSSTGVDYNTADDNKPNTIVTQDGRTYEIIPGRTIGNETGKVVDGTTEITYVYKEVKGNVVVNYIDVNGNVIAQPVVDTPETSTGVDYDTTDNKPAKIVAQDGKTYVILPALTKGAETGKVVKGTTEVTYVYSELTKGNDVVVNYIDENGNVIKNPVNDTKDSSTGVDYNTSDDNKPKTIVTPDGKTYVIVPEKTIGEETGKVKEGKTEVTYVYREVKGNVVVNYVDVNGNVLAPSVTDTPETSTGVDYDTTDNKPNRITKDGKTYELVRVEGSETGKVVEGTTTVTYVYKLVTTTTFVDENGNEIAPGQDGNHPFANVPGYKYVETRTDKDGNVTHVYRKDSAKPAAPATPKAAKPAVKKAAKPAAKKAKVGALPKTSASTETNSALPAGLAAALAAAGLLSARRRKEDK